MTKPADKKENRKGLEDLGKGEKKNPITGCTEEEEMEKADKKARREFLKSRR